MGGLCVLLQVCVVVGLKTLPYVDLVRIINRGADPGRDIPVLHHPFFQEGDVDDLPDERAGERLEPHILDPVLDFQRDLMRGLELAPLYP